MQMNKCAILYNNNSETYRTESIQHIIIMRTVIYVLEIYMI